MTIQLTDDLQRIPVSRQGRRNRDLSITLSIPPSAHSAKIVVPKLVIAEAGWIPGETFVTISASRQFGLIAKVRAGDQDAYKLSASTTGPGTISCKHLGIALRMAPGDHHVIPVEVESSGLMMVWPREIQERLDGLILFRKDVS